MVLGMRDAAPLVAFHLRVGVRLAQSAAAPLAALPVFAILLQHDPGGALHAAAQTLVGPRATVAGGMAVAAASALLARWAAPRVTAGLDGWMRHLPVPEATQRRAALIGLLAAQTPLAAALAALAPFALARAHALSLARLAALPLMFAAAALLAWPGCRGWRSRPFAAAALVGAASTDARVLLASLVLLAAAERWAGAIATPGAQPRRRSHAIPTPLLVAARALGPTLLWAPLLGLLPLAVMAALRTNNDLSPALARGAARFGGGLALVLTLAVLVERLAVHRPAWPWIRSLPQSAAQRVGSDALVLAAPCLVPLAATACLDTWAALATAACLPFFSFRAVSALRRSALPRMGAGAPFAAEAALLASWVTLVPALAFAACAAAWPAAREAAARDRRQKVSGWDDRHRQAAGDPLSWSAR